MTLIKYAKNAFVFHIAVSVRLQYRDDRMTEERRPTCDIAYTNYSMGQLKQRRQRDGTHAAREMAANHRRPGTVIPIVSKIKSLANLNLGNEVDEAPFLGASCLWIAMRTPVTIAEAE